MRVAIVHEYFCNLGGADNVARVLHEMYPDAPVFTLQIYDRNRGSDVVRGMELRTSFIQRLPFAGRTHQIYLPLMPIAIEQFDLRGFDVILSSSSLIAKGLIAPQDSLHISYTQTRQRVAWDLESEYVAAVPGLFRPLARLYMHWLRVWDVAAAQRVDHFVANSHFVARRIEQLYRRTATVIHPPVDTDTFKPSNEPRGDYYVAVARLVKYKRIDLAIVACKQLGRPLHIIGDGPERAALEKMAGQTTSPLAPLLQGEGNTIQFLGAQPPPVVCRELARARGLLFPGLEDFGIVPVEAQAVGCPVIAYGKGGVLDTVVDGVTGILFEPQTTEGLVQAMQRAEELRFDPAALRENALRFSTERFKARLRELIEELLSVD